MQLIEPSIQYKSSYIDMIQNFDEHNEKPIPMILQENYQDFPALLNRLQRYSEGDVPAGFVPHKTYWLIDNKQSIVGAVNLRLHLTHNLRQRGGHIGYGIKPSERRKGYATLLLAKTLDKAKALGLSSVLITCDKLNIASAKTIQLNQGVLDFEGKVAGFDAVIQRYWIQL